MTLVDPFLTESFKENVGERKNILLNLYVMAGSSQGEEKNGHNIFYYTP